MKKLFTGILLSILFIIFPFIINAFAVEASLGVSTWYAWWDFKDGDMKVDSALLFGPVASLRISESWSLSGVFLYGKFKMDGYDDSDIKRYDSDLSLNYNINRYFKIFAGGKYMAFTWNQAEGEGKHWSAGPGLGIGSTLPLTESLYLLLNVSGTYSLGKHESPSNNDSNQAVSDDLVETSFNTNASLAYYIKSASTSVNLGFRYQLIKSDNKDDNSEDDYFSFYGPSFSVVYSF